MMTSVSTRAPVGLNPTRQQLDELDSLLQRMLELPVNTLDEEEEMEAEEAAMEPPSSPMPSPPSPQPPPVLPAREPRSVPHVSYTVVETASPRPIPAASGFEPRPSMLSPRLVPVTTPSEAVEDDAEPFAPPTPTPLAQSPPSSPIAPQMPFDSDSPENEAELWVPLRSTWQPSAHTWQPLADSWLQATEGDVSPMHTAHPVPMPGPGLEPMPVSETMFPKPASQPPSPPAPPPLEESPASPLADHKADKVEIEKPVSTEAAVEPPLLLTSEDLPPSAPLALLPLVWLNRGFDACMSPLGAPGRWARGPRGRQLLGLAGLASLTAAAILALSAGMGWCW